MTIRQNESGAADEVESVEFKPAAELDQPLSPVKLESSIDISQRPYDE